MGIDELIEAEAQAQAICMATGDFRRAFEAFAAKRSRTSRGTEHEPMATRPDARPSRLAVLRATSIAPSPSELDRLRCSAAVLATSITTMSTPPAARWSQRSAQAGLLDATACRRRRRTRDDDRFAARSASPARRWPMHDGLADFAFAMQGLGTGAISACRRSEALQQAILPKVARGEWIAAFALSEPDAGSDVAAMRCAAARATATTTCSTARRPGSPTAASPTSTPSSPAPARRPARAASPPSWSSPTIPASRSPSASR